jgi:hypothetical protein
MYPAESDKRPNPVIFEEDRTDCLAAKARIDNIRNRANRAGKLTRAMALSVLTELAGLSLEKANAQLAQYAERVSDAFAGHRPKKRAKLLDELDWTFAVATQYYHAEHLARRAMEGRDAVLEKSALTDVARTLPGLRQVPPEEYERALKEVEAFCSAFEQQRRAEFERDIRPYELASLALQLGDPNSFGPAKDLLFRARLALVPSAEWLLTGPPYEQIPLSLFAPCSKGSRAKGVEPLATRTSDTDSRGFLGPRMIENLRTKLWQLFAPEVALEIIQRDSISLYQAAKLRCLHKEENRRHSAGIHPKAR